MYDFLWNDKENQTSQTLRHSLDILDIDTQLNFLKIKWIQRFLTPTNTLRKDLILYWLNIDLILKFNQVLCLFRQKQIPRYNRHKNLKKQNNKDFFIQLLNAWQHFTYYKFPTRGRSRTTATSMVETCWLLSESAPSWMLQQP